LQVRLRPHPCENSQWYLEFINTSFFKIDLDSISDSLKKSTLIIGPTSTTIIDALAHQVNYLIYEPTIEGKTLMGFPITPPLDGLDSRIPIARNEYELEHILVNKKCIDISVYEEFVSPNVDFSFLKKYI